MFQQPLFNAFELLGTRQGPRQFKRAQHAQDSLDCRHERGWGLRRTGLLSSLIPADTTVVRGQVLPMWGFATIFLVTRHERAKEVPSATSETKTQVTLYALSAIYAECIEAAAGSVQGLFFFQSFSSLSPRLRL